jgi:hypothetical protein
MIGGCNNVQRELALSVLMESKLPRGFGLVA